MSFSSAYHPVTISNIVSLMPCKSGDDVCGLDESEESSTVANTVKQAVIHLIESLPDDASVADIMAELYFHRKVEEGLAQLDTGQGIDHETAKQRLHKWLG